jgi:hypothetical protein
MTDGPIQAGRTVGSHKSMKFQKAHLVAAAALLLLAPSTFGQVTNVYLPDSNAAGGAAANMIPFSDIFGAAPGSWSHLTIIPASMLAAQGVLPGDKLVDIRFAPCGTGVITMPNVQVVVGHLVSPLPTFSLLNGFADTAVVYDSAASGPLTYPCVANTWCSLGVGGGNLGWDGVSDVGVYTTHSGLSINTTTGWQGSFWRAGALMRHYVNSYQATMALSSILNGLKIGLVFANATTFPAMLTQYGQGSAGWNGIPALVANEFPTFGNQAFGLALTQALPGSMAVLIVSSAPADVQMGVGADVRLLVDLSPSATPLFFPMPVGGFGTAFFGAAIPSWGPGLEGFTVFCQWAVVGDQAAAMTVYGLPLALTDGLAITLGL